MTKIKKIFYLFFPLLCGSLIGLLISKYIDYDLLIKPNLAPPGYIFPIAWSIIYIILGISYYIFKKDNEETSLESKVYYGSLIINLLWSIIFFILKWRFITVIWTIILWLSIIFMIYLFSKKNKLSAYLNIPYLLWCTYAIYLTIGVYLLN